MTLQKTSIGTLLKCSDGRLMKSCGCDEDWQCPCLTTSTINVQIDVSNCPDDSVGRDVYCIDVSADLDYVNGDASQCIWSWTTTTALVIYRISLYFRIPPSGIHAGDPNWTEIMVIYSFASVYAPFTFYNCTVATTEIENLSGCDDVWTLNNDDICTASITVSRA